MIDADIDGLNATETAAGAQVPQILRSQTTVGENIDNRIAQHKDAIRRLEQVKEKLAGGSLLDVSLSDLQNAMRW